MDKSIGTTPAQRLLARLDRSYTLRLAVAALRNRAYPERIVDADVPTINLAMFKNNK